MMRSALTALCLLAFGGGAVAADGAPEHLRLARYTTAAALPDPTLTQPLAVLAHVSFPRDAVTTVGEALDYLLLRTGYRLGDADAPANALLGLPLPEAHRQLGPYSVHAIAAVLVGSAYELQVSEIDRRVVVVLAEPAPQTPASIATAPAAEPAPREPRAQPAARSEASLTPLTAPVTVGAEDIPVEFPAAPESPIAARQRLQASSPADPFAEVLP